NTFLIGVILALLVERSGSLWGATLAHGVWNFAVACLVSVPVSGINIFHLLDVTPVGPARLTGGPYGPEASVVVTAIALPVVGLLLAPLLSRRKGAERTEEAPI
ncbi:MAG TPA: CPBP family intramembrane glutamic endopeptidase, partial [Thermoanaerobaculia bacterium]